MENVLAKIVVYYMNSYINYSWRYLQFSILKFSAKIKATFLIKCSQKKIGLVPIITTSFFWWSNVLVRWSKYQINSHRGMLQKLYNFRWLAASLWEKLDTTAQSVFDRADSWTGKVYRHLAAKRRTYTVKSPIILEDFWPLGIKLAMHIIMYRYITIIMITRST